MASLDEAESRAAAENAQVVEAIFRSSTSSSATDVMAEKIYLLRFGSAPSGGDGPQRFRQALLEGPALHHCRASLEVSGHSCVLPQGALIFVRPESYREVLVALSDLELHPFHVIAGEAFEHSIEEVLASFSFQQRPKLKPGVAGRMEISVRQSLAFLGCRRRASGQDGLEEGRPGTLCEKRTFLCCVPSLSDARTVAQSSTEVVSELSATHYGSFRGVNPRRTSFEQQPDERAASNFF